MTEEVHVRFDTEDVEDAATKVRAALEDVGLTPELVRQSETRGIVATIFKPRWEANKDKLEAALMDQGLPGTFHRRRP